MKRQSVREIEEITKLIDRFKEDDDTSLADALNAVRNRMNQYRDNARLFATLDDAISESAKVSFGVNTFLISDSLIEQIRQGKVLAIHDGEYVTIVAHKGIYHANKQTSEAQSTKQASEEV